jgi:hypothetical protein
MYICFIAYHTTLIVKKSIRVKSMSGIKTDKLLNKIGTDSL